MSPTLDLVNDCFRFVTGFFEIIKESAPHIYHSALPLSPRTSIVRGLYQSHGLPLTRIVHGMPTAWESSIAAMKSLSEIRAAVWSPCSGRIAVVCGKPKATIEILDAATLGRLTILHYPQGELGGTPCLVFSPAARFLTWSGDNPGDFISWDVQTGVVVSTIPSGKRGYTLDRSSVTYSECGTMFGASFRNGNTFSISIYSVHSHTCIVSHLVDGTALHKIWTRGEYLRFAATTSDSIKTWEVGFTPAHSPTEVGSLCPPDNVRHFSFHPTPSLLAFTNGQEVKVWDALGSKFLLESVRDEWPRRMSFSHDGSLFACGTRGPEFYLWKESPTGYTLHRKLVSSAKVSDPLISPCGQSIIAFGGSTIQLWRTTDSTTPPSAIPSQALQRGEKDLIVGFSPDKALVAVARMEDETITVLEPGLRSGVSRLIIDTGMKVHGVGVTGSTVVVVGDGHIVTWNLPVGGHDSTPRANINDSVRTTPFSHPPFSTLAPRPTTSVSPDLRHAAVVEHRQSGSHLHLYDVRTGGCLASVPMGLETSPWFSPDGREIWCVTDSGEVDLWEIIENGESVVTNLEHRGSPIHLPDGFPWQPPHGYSVTESRWVLNSSGKRLLWLPPNWRSDGWNRMWGGRLLALLDRKLPDAVILELEE